MKRTLLSFLTTIAVLLLVSGHPLPAAAQTPAASPAATPNPFLLPVNHLLLRIYAGNGYEYMSVSPGHPAYETIFIIRDGELPDDMPPGLRDLYVELGVRDTIYMNAVIAPVDVPSGFIGRFGITIETRLITVSDGDAAAQLVDRYPGILARQAPDRASAASITEIGNLPPHNEAIVGITGVDPYFFLATGEASGHQVPYTRFIAQHGATVASVKVTSLDPAFNDAVARDLLRAQLACLTANAPCAPVPIAEGTGYEPGTPVASPVATRRVSRPRLR